MSEQEQQRLEFAWFQQSFLGCRLPTSQLSLMRYLANNLFKTGYESGRREQKEADAAIADAEYEKLLELRGKANQVGDFAHGERLDRAARTANDIAEAIRKQGE
jgi:hypothetical protein